MANIAVMKHNARAGMRIGIDWGGTKIEGIAMGEDGAILARRRLPTPRHDYDACLRLIADLVAWLEGKTGTSGTVGIGIPGALSPATGLVKNANSTWMIGKPLQQDLERLLDRPVRIANDANCLAVSEAADGAGAGARVVFAVILGTGVGGGIVVDGQVLTGRHAIGGEWGHNPFPGLDARQGAACYCGRRGCVETYLSGPAMAAEHRRRTGREMTAAAIAEAARQGDEDAVATLDIYTERLARALAVAVNMLDPDVIVIGGGLSNIADLYARLPERMRPHVFSDRFDTPIRPAAHGDSSGVRGAAWLWPRQG